MNAKLCKKKKTEKENTAKLTLAISNKAMKKAPLAVLLFLLLRLIAV